MAVRYVGSVLVVAAAVVATPAHADEGRSMVLSHLWLPRPAIDPVADDGVEHRGVPAGESDRGRRAGGSAGFEDHRRRFRDPGTDVRWTLSTELTGGALDYRGLDQEDLLRRYPSTLPEELLGGATPFRADTRLEVTGPLDRRQRLALSLAAGDLRLEDRPLGAGVNESIFRGDYTLNLAWQPTPTTRVTAGARYDRETADNAGLSTWFLPSAARDRRRDEAVAVVTGTWQPHRRHQLSLLVDGSRYRDDYVPVNGLQVPGHDNLDTYQRWGNHPFRVRRREQRLYGELAWRGFADGLLVANDAHHLQLGASAERVSRSDDETRTGGFTFVDVVPVLPPDGQRPPGIDENDRSTWELLSSDRGDELHADIDHGNLALWLEDRWEVGSRFALRGGARLERFAGGFAGHGTSWDHLTLAPRVAARLRISEDGATAIHAGGGRFYQRMDESFVLRAREGAAYSPLEYWDWTGAGDAAVLPELGDPGWVRRAQFPAFVGDVDPDANQPHIDRLVVGTSTGLPDDGLTFSLRYEYRRFAAPLGLYDANATIYDPVDNPDGTYEQATDTFTPTGGVEESIGFLDLRPGATPAYTIGNPTGARRRFHQVVARGRARVTRYAVLTGAVRYTRDRGNFDAARGLSLEWRIPSGTLAAMGNMPGFDRVRADLGASLYLPGRVDLDIDYRFHSGEYYSRVIRVSPTVAPRTFVFDARGRGGYRYPSRHLIDAKLQRSIPWTGPGRLRAWVRVRNLLGRRNITGFREQARLFQSLRSVEAPLQLFVGVRHDY